MIIDRYSPSYLAVLGKIGEHGHLHFSVFSTPLPPTHSIFLQLLNLATSIRNSVTAGTSLKNSRSVSGTCRAEEVCTKPSSRSS